MRELVKMPVKTNTIRIFSPLFLYIAIQINYIISPLDTLIIIVFTRYRDNNMHNLYKFEAVFETFFNYRKLTPRVKKSYLVFFRSFLNWLVLKLEIKSSIEMISDFIPFLENHSLEKYDNFLRSTKLTKTGINLRISLLKDFKIFLEKNKTNKLNSKKDTEGLAKKALVEEFLADRENQGAKSTTLRSYKSDINQFLYFLETRE